MDRSARVEGPVDAVVVGAGLAGATAARALVDAGLRVVAIDKGRGPGGRLSTRRTAAGTFDHGAAVLQAGPGGFGAWLDAEVSAGRAARHDAGWVGVPGMNALVAGLLDGVNVRWSTAAAALRHDDRLWHVLDAGGNAVAAAPSLVLAVPAPQAAGLLRAGGTPASPSIDGAIAGLSVPRYAPCWAALVEVEGRHAATVLAQGREGPLEAIHREADKPARPDVGHWVLHATAAWSDAHLEESAEAIALRLRAAFAAATGIDDAAIRHVSAHRWRYARPTVVVDPATFEPPGLFIAGDAFVGKAGAGVAPAEQAWQSGRAAAGRLLAACQPKS